MATITIPKKEFEKNVKLSGDLSEKLMMSGISVDKIDDKNISLEITANRPDLLSAQGVYRHLKAYFGKETGLKEYNVGKPEKNFKVKIDSSVKNVRPYTVCAIVKGLKFDYEKIREIIDLQEKLHNTIGRNRKKLAIGIYPLEKITLPIKYEARKPQDIRFQPLEFPRELSGLQILSQHPTGRDYANLLEGKDKFPVFVDAGGKILSMPPIINSNETGKITESTENVFIECSGFDFNTLEKTLNIFVTTLAEMGGKIYAMELDYDKKIVTPNLNPEKMKVSLEHVNKLIGLNLKESDLKNLLPKMGYNYSNGIVSVPAWRTDILHEVDIIEDVAIAYGYDNLVPEIPRVSTIGEEAKIEKLKTLVANILVGTGMTEISSYHLIKQGEIAIAGQKEEILELENSKTEYKYLRNNLIVPMLRILSENKDSEYPQKMFEVGNTFQKDQVGKQETGIIERQRLCVTMAYDRVTFTDIKQILDYLLRMLKVDYKLEETDNQNFIMGRTGKIVVGGSEVGIIGEIHPRTLKNWSIDMPVVLLEIGLDFLAE